MKRNTVLTPSPRKVMVEIEEIQGSSNSSLQSSQSASEYSEKQKRKSKIVITRIPFKNGKIDLTEPKVQKRLGISPKSSRQSFKGVKA